MTTPGYKALCAELTEMLEANIQLPAELETESLTLVARARDALAVEAVGPMTDQHPITPPPEMVDKWRDEWFKAKVKRCTDCEHIAAQAARWGADQELEACCERVEGYSGDGGRLRAARRPQPELTLREKALARTNAILNDPSRALLAEERDVLELNRRALQAADEFAEEYKDDLRALADSDSEPAAAPDRPLWDAMRNARLSRNPAIWHECDSIAAELRVVADWLEAQGDGTPWMEEAGVFATSLRAEAERAEAGE
jgi:hypothetical protein